MLDALQFVKGAVAKKDYQPGLTHFLIRDGRVMSYNGMLALSSPVDLDILACPKAVPFIKALERCEGETTVVHQTKGGKLALRSGSFQAYIECTEDTELLYGIEPEGETVSVPEQFIQALKVLAPFVSVDASRPWSLGIFFTGEYAYATNNIIVAEYHVGEHMPDVIIPASAVAELTRIGDTPIGVQLGKNSATFHYAGDRWLRTQLLVDPWPNVKPLLDKGFQEANLKPFPTGIFAAIDILFPFIGEEGRLHFRENTVSTSLLEGDGASVEIADIPNHGAYHYHQLSLLQWSVTSIDFSKHPEPCPFIGTRLRGIFLGMREDA